MLKTLGVRDYVTSTGSDAYRPMYARKNETFPGGATPVGEFFARPNAPAGYRQPIARPAKIRSFYYPYFTPSVATQQATARSEKIRQNLEGGIVRASEKSALDVQESIEALQDSLLQALTQPPGGGPVAMGQAPQPPPRQGAQGQGAQGQGQAQAGPAGQGGQRRIVVQTIKGDKLSGDEFDAIRGRLKPTPQTRKKGGRVYEIHPAKRAGGDPYAVAVDYEPGTGKAQWGTAQVKKLPPDSAALRTVRRAARDGRVFLGPGTSIGEARNILVDM